MPAVLRALAPLVQRLVGRVVERGPEGAPAPRVVRLEPPEQDRDVVVGRPARHAAAHRGEALGGQGERPLGVGVAGSLRPRDQAPPHPRQRSPSGPVGAGGGHQLVERREGGVGVAERRQLAGRVAHAGVGAGVLAPQPGAGEAEDGADLLAALADVVDRLLQPQLAGVGERSERPVQLAPGQAPDVLRDGGAGADPVRHDGPPGRIAVPRGYPGGRRAERPRRSRRCKGMRRRCRRQPPRGRAHVREDRQVRGLRPGRDAADGREGRGRTGPPTPRVPSDAADREPGTGLAVTFFDTEEDLRAGDEVLNAMTPPVQGRVGAPRSGLRGRVVLSASAAGGAAPG